MYVLRFLAELVKPFSPGATVQPSARFEVPLIKAESEFDLLPIPIFPDPAISTARALRWVFRRAFVCLVAVTFGTARITLSISPVPVWRAVKIEVAREDLREAITYQKSTTSKPVSAAPKTSIDQSPASRPKRRSAAVLARITRVSQRFEGVLRIRIEHAGTPRGARGGGMRKRPTLLSMNWARDLVSTAMTIVALVSGRLPSTC